jgi:vancomycin resistance protein VanJ
MGEGSDGPVRGRIAGAARAVAWGALWCFGAVVLAGLVLRAWRGDEFSLGRYTGYLLPWIGAALVPGTIAAAWGRRAWLAAALAAMAALIVAKQTPLLRYRPVIETPAAAVPLRVMSFNTYSRNDADERIAAVVRDVGPDLLLLQEVPRAVFARVAERLRADGRLVHVRYDAGLMQGVASRYAIERRASMREKAKAQSVVVRAPAGPIAVYNVHPPSGGGWQVRYEQVKALLEEEILRESGPVIVGGDFNVTPHSQMYLMLARHLRNAHDEAGEGLGFTFPAAGRRTFGFLPLPPLVRIDHVFVSGHFLALGAGTVRDSAGSDHHPVWAELAHRPAECEPVGR